MKDFIVRAINASMHFEEIMDRIDFNSYLLEDKKKIEKNQPSGYSIFLRMVKVEALKYYKESIQNKLPKRVKSENFSSGLQNQEDLTYYLIYRLFEAKKTRLAGRQEVRKREERCYKNGVKDLNKAFDNIEKKYFDYNGKNIFEYYNWAKVLYYNELSIYYSGLARSSMSLGYAEESIFLLEKIHPELLSFNKPDNKRIDIICRLKSRYRGLNNKISPADIIKLYTFALYNKGEADRLLKKLDSAKSTFQRIVDIYANFKDFASLCDCISALQRQALILLDQGRGKEALNCFTRSEEFQKQDTSGLPDYRIHYSDLEKISSLIDQKEYKDAWEKLKKYLDNGTLFSKNTFVERQAKIRLLHLLNEFRENRPENFQITQFFENEYDWGKLSIPHGFNNNQKNITYNLILKNRDINQITNLLVGKDKSEFKIQWEKLQSDSETPQEMKNEYPKFEENARELIKQAYERKDGDSFKETCTKFARFYQIKEKRSNEALKYYFLYLLENKIYSNILDIDDWLDNQDLNVLIKNNQEQINKVLSQVREDEKYLKDFFDEYIKNDEGVPTLNFSNNILKKIKDRLVEIYYQSNKDTELEKVKLDYELFKYNSNQKSKKNVKIKGRSTKFIENSYFKNLHGGMKIESISNRMRQNMEKFLRKVDGTTISGTKSDEKIKGRLSVLRRWNSFTPTLNSSIHKSKGGGYFLRLTNTNKSLGIVIDPGYDFLDNFFSQGYKIGDIDFVLVSHSHPDHTADLPSLLSLLHEKNGKLGKYISDKETNKKNLTLILSPGVFDHYNKIISSSEKELKDIIVVEFKGNEYKEEEYKRNEYKTVYEDKLNGIEIKAFETTHQDLSQFQSLGFIINFKINGQDAIMGYTGDIKWNSNKLSLPKYLKHLKTCNIVCIHLGSLVNMLEKRDFCKTFCDSDFMKESSNLKCENCRTNQYKDVNVTKRKMIEQTSKENHLYLAGLTMLFDYLINEKENRVKLAIISEFGEELKTGIRIDLCNKFNNWLKENKKNLTCLPGDIGLEVDILTGNVYCHCCKGFVKSSDIKPVPYGKEEAICFVCKECEEVLSTNQIDLILKEYCENGRQLESVDSNSF